MDLRVGRAELALKGEDSILQNDELGLFGVLDGLGGHGSGEVASRVSRDAIETYFLEHTPSNVVEAIEAMKEAFRKAGQAILAASAQSEISRHMATTVSIIYLLRTQGGEKFSAFGHIGDSRIYYLPGRTGYAGSQLTNDESTKHGLTNSLSGARAKCEQTGAVSLRSPSRFVICSDGVYGWEEWPLSKSFLAALCIPDAQEAAEKLAEYSAIQDDKSVLVIDL